MEPSLLFAMKAGVVVVDQVFLPSCSGCVIKCAVGQSFWGTNMYEPLAFGIYFLSYHTDPGNADKS